MSGKALLAGSIAALVAFVVGFVSGGAIRESSVRSYDVAVGAVTTEGLSDEIDVFDESPTDEPADDAATEPPASPSASPTASPEEPEEIECEGPPPAEGCECRPRLGIGRWYCPVPTEDGDDFDEGDED